MTDALTIIDKQRISTIVGEYYECTECRVADTFMRAREGTICPTCKKRSDSGMSFFDLSVLIMLDLLQEAYRAIPPPDDKSRDHLQRVTAYSASVLVFYCTIRERLLIRFIYALMTAMRLPVSLCRRLDADNDSHAQRLFNLFPALTGMKWEQALNRIPTKDGVDWLELNQSLGLVSNERNAFLHEGQFTKGRSETASECVKNIFPLLELFIELNNLFVHPLHLQRI
jgi:hypothetical protein